jgi:hypothetical protein
MLLELLLKLFDLLLLLLDLLLLLLNLLLHVTLRLRSSGWLLLRRGC